MNIIKRIEETDRQLQKSKSAQKATLKDYRLIQSKIKDRERLLSTIQNELILADEELGVIEVQNEDLKTDLELIQQKYYYVLNQIYKRNISQNKWTFILDAQTINETFKRWRYVKQYEAYIQEIHKEISALGVELTNSKVDVQSSKSERMALLKSENQQFELLKESLVEKDRILEQIKDQTSELEIDLQKQKANREKLNSAIESVIIAALSGDKTNNTSGEISEKSNNSIVLTSSFQENKGNLPWPVNNSRVSSKFGKHKHEALKNIYVQNNGIDIDCAPASQVNSIFAGEVASVNQIQGFGFVVIVRHGTFYSVYSKLESVQVQKGQNIQSQEAIGICMTEEGRGILHLEIWEGKEKTNPSIWLGS